MKHFIALGLLFLTGSASAVSSFASLPSSVQTCINAGLCTYGGMTFGYSINDNLILAHNFTDYRSGGAVNKLLMEYHLGTGSHTDSVGFDYNSYNTLPLQTTSIGGTLWLEANMFYNLSNPLHAMTLHFDQTQPAGTFDPWSYQYSTTELSLTLNTSGLLAGHAETFGSCCDEPTPTTPFSSTASSNASLFGPAGEYPLLCVAEGCYIGAILNLIGVEYIDAGGGAAANFTTRDNGELLFYSAEGYEGYTHNTYSLSAVPLPAAAWLFGSGLVALLGLARTKLN